jgi:hypothetical protein
LIGFLPAVALRVLALSRPSARHAVAGGALLLCVVPAVGTLVLLTHPRMVPFAGPATLALAPNTPPQAPHSTLNPAPANLQLVRLEIALPRSGAGRRLFQNLPDEG